MFYSFLASIGAMLVIAGLILPSLYGVDFLFFVFVIAVLVYENREGIKDNLPKKKYYIYYLFLFMMVSLIALSYGYKRLSVLVSFIVLTLILLSGTEKPFHRIRIPRNTRAVFLFFAHVFATVGLAVTFRVIDAHNGVTSPALGIAISCMLLLYNPQKICSLLLFAFPISYVIISDSRSSLLVLLLTCVSCIGMNNKKFFKLHSLAIIGFSTLAIVLTNFWLLVRKSKIELLQRFGDIMPRFKEGGTAGGDLARFTSYPRAVWSDLQRNNEELFGTSDQQIVTIFQELAGIHDGGSFHNAYHLTLSVSGLVGCLLSQFIFIVLIAYRVVFKKEIHLTGLLYMCILISFFLPLFSGSPAFSSLLISYCLCFAYFAKESLYGHMRMSGLLLSGHPSRGRF